MAISILLPPKPLDMAVKLLWGVVLTSRKKPKFKYWLFIEASECTALLIKFYVHNSPVPKETKPNRKGDKLTFYLTANILYNQAHTHFWDLPLSFITPRRVGSRRWLERQHTYLLSLADTTDLCWVFWSQARKLNSLLNKLIGKMPQLWMKVDSAEVRGGPVQPELQWYLKKRAKSSKNTL